MSKTNKYHQLTSFPDSHQDTESMEELINNEHIQPDSGHLDSHANAEPTEMTQHSIWQIEYYQKYFDVNTTEVFAKLRGSMTPTFNQNYFNNQIRPNPDLYGPFWVTMTLIFTIAITGNFVSFIENFGSDFKWHTDFHKVSTSAAAIITYWWLAPTILYFLMRWRFQTAEAVEFSFLELLSVYGYSLTVFIPTSFFWMIDVSIVQWALVLVAVALSGSVLFSTFWPSLSKDSSKQIALVIAGSVLLLHLLLGLGFMLYFFHNPQVSAGPDVTTTTIKAITTTVKA